MSHIPSSKMPHAKPHDDEQDEQGGQAPEAGAQDAAPKESGGVQGAISEQVSKLSEAATSSASAAGEAVKSAAASVSDQAGSAATAVSERASAAADAATDAAKTAATKVNGLPTYAKLIGAAALVGGIAAVAVLPFLGQPEETGRAKRKKNKGDKKA